MPNTTRTVRDGVVVLDGWPANSTAVFDLTDGVVLRRVARDPGAGDYVADDHGSFFFAAGAEGHAVRFSNPSLSETLAAIGWYDDDDEDQG
jgi:hypothetical protein